MATAQGMEHPFWSSEATKCMETFRQRIKEAIDEQDMILHISCGIGNLTKEVILPTLDGKFHSLVAADVPRERMEALKNANTNPKIIYDTLDISGDVTPFLGRWGCFKFVFCFFAKQWKTDITLVLRNIRRLLSRNGQCLIAFVSSSPVYDVLMEMADEDPYAIYLQDVDEYIPRTRAFPSSSRRLHSFSTYLERTGFHVYFCSDLLRTYNFQSTSDISDFYSRSVEIFMQRMHRNGRLQQNFLDECITRVHKGYTLEMLRSQDKEAKIEYHLLVAYAIALHPSQSVAEKRTLPRALSNEMVIGKPFHASSY